MWKRGYIIIVFILFFSCLLQAEPPDSSSIQTDEIKKGRLIGVIAVQGVLSVASFGGLYFAWYRDYPQSSFHFFNDNDEWMQSDKFGHATTVYYLSRLAHASYRWAGMNKKTAAWLGGAVAFAYNLNTELLDAFSAGWGFSAGDIASNALGSALFISQQLLWDEQKFNLKYSYHPTEYPSYRPDLLGRNLIQQMLKDYNGMTFWLSGNIHSFLPKSSKFPAWLNIAIGYGAEGMTGAQSNSDLYDMHRIPHFDRYRKFFLSVDVDLTRIPTRSKVLKGIFLALGFIKIPAPAIEYNTLGQFKFHPFYF